MENKRLAIFVFEIYLYFKHLKSFAFNLLKFNAREFEFRQTTTFTCCLFMSFMSLQESIHKQLQKHNKK